MKFAQRAVVARHLSLSLQYVDFHRSLVVRRRREYFGLARWNRRGALEQLGEDASERLNAQAERGHVEQQQVFHLARKHARLHPGADRHDLVRVDPLVRVLREEGLDHLLNLRDARRTAHQNDLVDLAGLQSGVFQSQTARLQSALQNVVDQGFEFGARQLHHQMLRTRLVGGDERQVDLRLHRRGEFDLGLLGGLFQTLQRHLIFRQIDALVFLELINDPLDQSLVNVVSAQMSVAVCRFHLDHAFADFQDRYVERAATEVEDRDGLVLLLVQAVSQSRRRRLIDYAQHIQTGDPAGVLSGLTLRIVEIGRNGDDGLRNLLPQIIFGSL